MAGNSVGTAYLTLVPKLSSTWKTSVQGEMSKINYDGTGDKAEKSGKKTGSRFGSAMKTAAIVGIAALGTGIAAIGKQALASYANYEQLVGGVDKLYGNASAKVQEYAANAYKTVGMSANDYMETATQFSAAMTTSLGGNVNKSAEQTQKPMEVMSDNVNVFGSNFEDVSNAFKGFSKQNYTMLDNLKLGYGGTKTEMERLLADAQKISGVKYDISSLSDITDAIQVIQTQMNITGTTAKEAMGTVEGSVNSAKAAWSNWLTGLGTPNADMTALTTNLVNSVSTVVTNIMPILSNVITGICQALPQLLSTLLPAVLQLIISLAQQLPTMLLQLTTTIIEFITNNASTILDAVLTLITGLLEMMPQFTAMLVQALPQLMTTICNWLVQALPQIIQSLITWVTTSLPLIIECGIQLFTGLIEALGQIIPVIIEMLPDLIVQLVSCLIESAPKLGAAMLKALGALVKAVPKIVGALIKAVGSLLGKIVDKIKGFASNIATAAKNMIKGMVNGITDAAKWVYDKIKELCSNVVDKIKDFFGIHSPSRLMAEMGRYVTQGFANGITSGGSAAISAMQGIASSVMDAANIGAPQLNATSTLETATATNAMGATDDVTTDNAAAQNRNIVINLNYSADADANQMVADIARGLRRMNLAGA